MRCGKAREKIYETEGKFQRRWSANNAEGSPYESQGSMQNIIVDKGYTDCGCNAGFEPGVVLDPFAGSGTTGAVTKKLGRKYIGIEISPAYCQLHKKRLQTVPLAMELVA